MRIVGHFEDGKVVFDTPPAILDGTPVNVDILPRFPDAISYPAEMTTEEFIAKLNEIADSQPVCDWHVDVSRESIYD